MSSLSFRIPLIQGKQTFFGATVLLDSDINFGEELSQQFKPIGNDWNIYFNGTFDGQGHTISNLAIDSSLQRTGLFGFSRGLTIQNVVIDNTCSILVPNSYYNTYYAGGFLGYGHMVEHPCIIENSVNMVDITLSGHIEGRSYFGGFAGIMYSPSYKSSIKNCANYGSIKILDSAHVTLPTIGGIVGMASGGSSPNELTIQNCLNYGAIEFYGTLISDSVIGGIVGDSSSSLIENCVFFGGITTNGIAGSIGNLIGKASSTDVTHSFWITENEYNLYGLGDLTFDYVSSLTSADLSFVDELSDYSSSKSWSCWVFNKNQVSVTFRINKRGGFTTNAQIILLANPVESDGLTFSGWFNDSLLTNSFIETEINSNTTLYGMLCESGYTVSLNVNGGDASSLPRSHPMAIECNGVYGTLPIPTRTEHKFVGWFTRREGGYMVKSGSQVTSGAGNMLYAQWNLNNYSLTFNFDNGTEPEVRTVGFNTTIDYPMVMFKEGYSFNGWDSNPERMPAHNFTATALWNPNNYTVKFDMNGGGGEITVKEIMVTYNSTYGTLPVPNRSGFVFIEWITDKNKSVTNETIMNITYNHTLYAHWEEVKTSQVEIVFETKDLTEEEIKGLIDKYTDESFTITKYESSGESGEIRIIVSFTDAESAAKFVNKLKVSSEGTVGIVRKIDFIEEKTNNLSGIFYPPLLLNILF